MSLHTIHFFKCTQHKSVDIIFALQYYYDNDSQLNHHNNIDNIDGNNSNNNNIDFKHKNSILNRIKANLVEPNKKFY